MILKPFPTFTYYNSTYPSQQEWAAWMNGQPSIQKDSRVNDIEGYRERARMSSPQFIDSITKAISVPYPSLNPNWERSNKPLIFGTRRVLVYLLGSSDCFIFHCARILLEPFTFYLHLKGTPLWHIFRCVNIRSPEKLQNNKEMCNEMHTYTKGKFQNTTNKLIIIIIIHPKHECIIKNIFRNGKIVVCPVFRSFHLKQELT